MSGIKKITDEVKQAVAKSVEPMKNLTNQAKSMASSSASSVSQMKAKMKSYKSSVTETAKQQEYLKSKIADLKDMLAKADAGFEVGDTMKIESQLEQLKNKLRKLESQGNKSGKKTADAFDIIKTKVKGARSHIVSLASKLKNVLANSKNLGKGFTNTFNNGLKSIKKFALGLLSVRTAFSMISKAMQSYLSYDKQLSDSIQNCWNVLGSLLAPVLEYIVALFSKVVSYVNAFVQALTGINLVAKANKKAIDSQAKSTKKLSEVQSSLDEFHSISDDNNSNNSDTQKPITVENVSLDGLLDKIFNYDWYSLGLEIGKKINEALSKINWDFIQSLAIVLASDLGSLLNGLVDGLDWTLIGSTIGNGLNTALMFAYTFLTTFNWQNFGTSIAKGLNGLFDTIDWSLLGQTLASKFMAIINTAYGFVTTYDWAKFGKSIAEAIMGFIHEINWSKAGETLSTGIRGIFSSLKEIIANINFQNIGKTLAEMFLNIDWLGIGLDIINLLVQGLLSIGDLAIGVLDAIVNCFTNPTFLNNILQGGVNIIMGLINGMLSIFGKIGEIWKKIVNAFKSFFGIHSPSTLFEGFGKNIIDGLVNGIKGIWNKVKEIFINLKTNIVNIFKNILSGIKNAFNLDSIKKHFKNAVSNIKNAFSSIGTWFKDKFKSAWTNIKNVFSLDSIKSHFKNILSSIKNIFSSIPNWFKDTFTKAWTNVKNVFSKGGKVFDGIKDGIANVFKNVVNVLIKGINKVVAIPFKTINGMLNKIHNVDILGFKPFEKMWKENPLPVPQIPELAGGGVLDRETIVKVAEYSNAKSNPEIISPRDMMKETMKEAIEETREINPTQKVEVDITGELTAKGDDLVYVYDKNKKDKGYDGGKNPSFVY